MKSGLTKKQLIYGILAATIIAAALVLPLYYGKTYKINGNWYSAFSCGIVCLETALTINILYKIQNKKQWKIVFGIFVLCLFWFVCKYIKWTSHLFVLTRYLWYLYYLPMIFIPYLFFTLCLNIFYSKTKISKLLMYVGFFIGAVLFIFVITNDFHQTVFSFDKGFEYFSTIYSRRIIYYFILVYCLLLIVASLFMLIFSTLKRNALMQYLYPFIIIMLLITYCILYICNVDFIVRIVFLSDMTFMYITFSLLLLQSFIRCGLIQNNGKYLKNFENCSLSICIFDSSDNVVCRNAAFDMDSYKEQSASQDKQFTTKTISNGYIVIEEDLTNIHRLRDKLNFQIEQLAKNNELLTRKKEIREEEASLRARTELMDEIEQAIDEKAKEIDLLTASLPDELTAENKNEVKSILGKLKLRIGYLKQKCVMILMTKQHKYISFEQFKLISEVMRSDLQSSGFEAPEFALWGSGDVPIRFAIAVNDMVISIAETFESLTAAMFVTVNVPQKKIKVLVECENNIVVPLSPSSLTEQGCYIATAKEGNEYVFQLTEVQNG